MYISTEIYNFEGLPKSFRASQRYFGATSENFATSEKQDKHSCGASRKAQKKRQKHI